MPYNEVEAVEKLHGDGALDKYAKHNDHRARRRSNWAAFWVGLVAGFIAAERLYLHKNPPRDGYADAVTGAAAGGQFDVTDQTAMQAAREQSAASPVTAAESRAGQLAVGSQSDLLQLLLRVAPSKEVLIAISDFNLVREGMLNTWIQVWYVG